MRKRTKSLLYNTFLLIGKPVNINNQLFIILNVIDGDIKLFQLLDILVRLQALYLMVPELLNILIYVRLKTLGRKHTNINLLKPQKRFSIEEFC